MRKTTFYHGGVQFHCLVWCCDANSVFHFIFPHSFVARFILEPKTVLFNEQEQKLNDSESAIASMQVCLTSDPVSTDCVKIARVK